MADFCEAVRAGMEGERRIGGPRAREGAVSRELASREGTRHGLEAEPLGPADEAKHPLLCKKLGLAVGQRG